jgi:hypothetical protein
MEQKSLTNILAECIKTLQEIKFICQRAKAFNVEEKDIDEILELLKGKV